MDRVIVLVDMDCFYVQVEQRLNPALKNKPCAVVQYKTWKGGGIIAVGYEARAFGVKRNMMGDDAKKLCPDILFARVPELRGKADLSKYREAGAEVIQVFSQFSQCVERASIDEAYVDLTQEVDVRMRLMEGSKVVESQLEHTVITGWEKPKSHLSDEEHNQGDDTGGGTRDWLGMVYEGGDMEVSNQRLAVGAVIVEEMRAAVYRETGFTCSAGIAHNKMLAKLACGFHKPNKQTVLPHNSVEGLFSSLPLKKVRHLGGKLGESLVQQLDVENMGDLCRFSERELQHIAGDKTGAWLYDMCRGLEYEPVSARQLAKSIGCSKTFPGKTCLDTREKVSFWLSELAKEVEERLVKDRDSNKRVAKTLTVTVSYIGNPSSVMATRSCGIIKYEAKKFTDDAFSLIQRLNTYKPHQKAWAPAILMLGLSASKFTENKGSGGSSISDLFAAAASQAPRPSPVMSDTSDTDNSALGQHGPAVRKPKRGSIETFFQTQTRDGASSRTNSSNIEHVQSTSDGDTVTSEAYTSIKQAFAYTDVTEKIKPKGFFASKTAARKFRHMNMGSVSETEDGDSNLSVPDRRETSSTDIVICASEGRSHNEVEMSEDHIPVESLEEGSGLTGEDSCDVDGADDDDDDGDDDDDVDDGAAAAAADDDDDDIDDDDAAADFDDVDGGSEVLTVGNSSDHDLTVTSDLIHHRQDNNVIQPSENFGSPDVGTGAVAPLDDDDVMRCDKCGRTLPIWEMPEHSDYHFALELQNSSQNATMVTQPSVSNQAKRKCSPDKRGKKTKKAKVEKGGGNSMNLLTFFRKQ
ncbi:DNA polymerase eta-like [Haliotis rufescens]|uniref:DNA polymerase eta-like n=1 Tax=Haliotis rufescens TaxID=6454 RepID=UPI00201EF0AE|nr:DNA polymerase eta-like [Haliotis rufescens]